MKLAQSLRDRRVHASLQLFPHLLVTTHVGRCYSDTDNTAAVSFNYYHALPLQEDYVPGAR